MTDYNNAKWNPEIKRISLYQKKLLKKIQATWETLENEYVEELYQTVV